MEKDKSGEASANSEETNSRTTPPSEDIPAPGAGDEALPGFVLYDEFEEIEAKMRVATRRRKILLGVALGLAAIAVPMASFLLAGRSPLSNPRPATRPLPSISRTSALPTPLPLTTEQRRVRDAKIAADLHNYVWNQVLPASHEEQAANKAFASVTDANYKDDKTSYGTIRNVVVPHFEHFVAMASAIRPETEQVRFVHHLMLTSARLKLMGFQQIAAGETDKDRLWHVGVLANFTESSRRAMLYQKSVAALARETHTKLP